VAFSSSSSRLAVVLPCDPLSSASRLAVAPSGTSLNDSRVYLALFQSALFAHTRGHSKAHNLTATRGLVAKGIACATACTRLPTRAAYVRLDWRRYCHAHSGLRCTQSADVISNLFPSTQAVAGIKLAQAGANTPPTCHPLHMCECSCKHVWIFLLSMAHQLLLSRSVVTHACRIPAQRSGALALATHTLPTVLLGHFTCRL
jgi:hypothetical protein